ncbi:MAG: two component transcriptional regulator, LuxR family [Planctomycetaceae bacterium]|nr:two component transcriptional regulator, LuxR family [Planctomycetaceae bacterium]
MAKSTPAKNNSRTRILIVDDHPIVREGLASLLSKQPDFEICGEADDLPKALELVAATKPHVITVDISLSCGRGLDLIRRIAESGQAIRVVVCSLHDETLYAERALQAGALGHVNKHEATFTIVKAIRQVLSGKIYLSDRMSELLARRMIGGHGKLERLAVDALSDRELEVFRLIGTGLTTAEIASQLHMSVKTIETHRRSINEKLSLINTAQLARDAAQWVLENG